MAKKKTKTKKPKKVFQRAWAYEAFEDEEGFYTKRMFGGLAVYVFGKMVMTLVESSGERSYRGVEYDFDIWDGILYPTFFEHHEALTRDFPNLIQHPVLKKWLFLPVDDPTFEKTALECAERIEQKDPLFGIFPNMDK